MNMNEIDLKLLELLHNGDFVSGEKISEEIGVSRTTIWKHINKLKQQGYQIESATNKGYRLVKIPDRIVPEEVYLGLKTDYIGREIKVFSSLGSTNERAKELARKDFPTGTVVIAEEQTAGKGRLGRSWFSPPGTGLWFSLIVRPDIPPNKAPFLTIIASLTLVKALSELNPELKPLIKWPNDILIDDRKVCGILSELNADLGMINFAVIGIGINVNQDYFPEELSAKATSLKIALNTRIDRTGLLQGILNFFEGYYQKLLEGRFKEILKEWKGYLNILGESVTIYSGSETYQGRVIDISSLGELVIKDNSGKVWSFWAGDVTLRKEEN
ncbi:MAG: BirA family transcriptional regulator [Halanaerobiales bacterium]|nr:BirA family transcriptional regulator [Halanaerobiales bacterium]